MTVLQLIELLRQCDASAPVTFEHDGYDHPVLAVEVRHNDGVVELLSGYRREEWETIFREIGRNVMFPCEE